MNFAFSEIEPVSRGHNTFSPKNVDRRKALDYADFSILKSKPESPKLTKQSRLGDDGVKNKVAALCNVPYIIQMSEQKTSLKLTDLLENDDKSVEQEPRKLSPIEKYHYSKFKNKEEIKAWRMESAKKRHETIEAKKAKQREMHAKAEELVPEVLAYDIASRELKNDSWIPKQETIDKIKLLLKKNFSIEEMRTKYFRGVSDETWHKVMKYVFKSQASQPEDLGAQIFQAKQRAVSELKKQVSLINKQIKEYKKERETKIIPQYLLKAKSELTMKLVEVETDVARTFHNIGAVGDKSKSPSIHVHVATPRPTKQEKVVEEI